MPSAPTLVVYVGAQAGLPRQSTQQVILLSYRYYVAWLPLYIITFLFAPLKFCGLAANHVQGSLQLRESVLRWISR